MPTVRARRRLLLPPLALAVLPAALASCFADPVGSGIHNPGEMQATLVSPNGAEGSAIFELVSGTIVAIAADEAYVHVLGVPTAPGRIVVLRRLPGAISFLLVADDVDHPPELKVLEVGDPDDRLRGDLSGYSVRLQGVTP